MTGLISPLERSDDSPPSEPVPEAPARTGDAPGEASREASREASDLAAVRELALRAHPDVVPELIGGQSVAAVIASIEPAQAAYARLAEQVTRSAGPPAAPSVPPSPNVPAGGSPPVPVDPERLPAAEKIRRGIRARAR